MPVWYGETHGERPPAEQRAGARRSASERSLNSERTLADGTFRGWRPQGSGLRCAAILRQRNEKISEKPKNILLFLPFSLLGSRLHHDWQSLCPAFRIACDKRRRAAPFRKYKEKHVFLLHFAQLFVTLHTNCAKTNQIVINNFPYGTSI